MSEMQNNQSFEEQFSGVDISELDTNGEYVKSVYFKNKTSSIIILITGLLLFLIKSIYAYLLGAFGICVALFVLFKIEDHKAFDIYKGFLIIYTNDEGTKGFRVDFDDIAEWTTRSNVSGVDAIMIRLKNGQLFYKNTFQLGRFYETMMRLLPEKESRVMAMEKNRQKEWNFHPIKTIKKWLKIK